MRFSIFVAIVLCLIQECYSNFVLEIEDMIIEAEESLLIHDFDFEQLTAPVVERANLTEYGLVTRSNTGCSCWFDPLQLFTEPGECACCKSDGVQCGYPMHEWCQPKVPDGQEQEGCMGILNQRDTLSAIGGFCHYRRGINTFDCAICVPGLYHKLPSLNKCYAYRYFIVILLINDYSMLVRYLFDTCSILVR